METDSKSIPSQAHLAPGTETIRLFSEAILDLNIARKNIQIYPATHEQVQRSVQRALGRLQPLLSDSRPFTVIVMDQGLMVAGERLDPKSPLFQELAHVLRQFEIVSLTLTQGLEKPEMLSFLKMLANDPHQTAEKGGLARLAEIKDLHHIQVRFIDYSLLQVTKEDEIRPEPENNFVSGFWTDFVSALLEGAEGGAVAAGTGNDPVQIAGLMNQRTLDPEKAVSCFEGLIASDLDVRLTAPPRSSTSPVAIDQFNQMLQELTPDLRKTFLSVVLDHCDRKGPTEATGRLLDTLGREMTLQMVRHAKADGKAISPSLLAFIQKVGGLESGAGKAAEGSAKQLSSSSVRTLLTREAYEHYVDGEYDRLLKGMGHTHDSGAPAEILAQDIELGLSEKEINCHTGFALVRLMAVSGDIGSYRDWARQLALMLDDLSGCEAFACLSDILAFVRSEHRQQPDPDKKKVTGLVLERFLDPRFISELLVAAEKKPDPEIFQLIRELGEPVACEIVESLSGNESAGEIETKLGLMEAFGPQAAAEAQKRLNDKRPERIVLMIRIIGAFGKPESIDLVRPLLEHADLRVRMEALSALVKHRNPWGLLRLREMVHEPWSHTTEHVMEIAGQFRVKEMVPYLSAMVQRRGSLAADFPRRTAALRALGRIGDPASLEVLKKLVRRRGILSGKQLIELKRTLFESLEGYPFQAVNELILFGLKHKDEAIQEVCRRLLRKRHLKGSDRSQKVDDSSTATP